MGTHLPRCPLSEGSCASPSISIQRLQNRRTLYSLWFLSDVDYQRRRSMLLIEGFLDDLLHRATILRSKTGQSFVRKIRKRTLGSTIRRTYRAPHYPIVTFRSIENHKLLLNIFPRLGFDLAFAKRHSLVDEFNNRSLQDGSG